MTGLSRCGRRYASLESAILAGELRTSKGARPLAVVACALGDHWHLVPPANVTGKGYSSPDPFPPPVRSLLVKRDECCQRCGHTGRLEAHHRRAKASGGSSARAHTQCACNGVLLCRRCHEWVQPEPEESPRRRMDRAPVGQQAGHDSHACLAPGRMGACPNRTGDRKAD